MRRFLLSAMLLAATNAAPAQTLQDVDKSEAALTAVWEKTPLTVRRAVFVTEQPAGFGVYNERPTQVFKPGEPLMGYVEPVGYGWKEDGNGTFEFGVSADILLKRKDGTIIGGKEDLVRTSHHSHNKNKEVFVWLTLNLNDAPAGDYVVEYRLHDLLSKNTATVNLPFSIATPQ